MAPLRVPRAVSLPAYLLAIVGCGGGDLVLPSDTGAARILAVGGNEQAGNAGSALPDPIVVRVADGDDRAVSGARVAFTLQASASGGEVSPDTVATDAGGLAETEWVLGANAGEQELEASVVGSSLSVRFTASASAGPASRILAAAGEEQSAAVGTALPESLAVRVEDQFGNPVAGVEVAWEASVGSVSPVTAETGADGRAATRRILGAQAGEQSATAAASGLDGSPVTFVHIAEPGTAASLVLISGDGQSAEPGEELPDPLVVQVVDESGNGIPDQAVTWVVATGGGSAAPGTSRTDGDGRATTRWTLGPTAGSNTLNAVASGVGVATFTATAADGGGGGGDPGPSASRSTVVADPTQIQAVTGVSSITVTVRDGDGDPVSGATVALQATGAGNLLTQPSGATGADGIATGAIQSAVPGTKVVSATVNGNIEVSQTATVTVTALPAERVELVEGDGQTAQAGTAVPVDPAVKVTDALGVPVAGFGVRFVVTAGGGNVNGAEDALVATNSAGIARVGSWTLGPAPGTNTLQAQAGTLEGSPVEFTAEGVGGGGGEVTGFRFAQQPPSRVEEDAEFSVTVELVGSGGDVVNRSGVVIELDLFRDRRNSPSNNRLEGVRERETVNGVAVFPGLSVDDGEDGYRLRAQAEELEDVPPVFSDPFDVVD